ncbi:MAG: methionine--tRNA ligase subunit beta [Phycisphaeraceae bacterium]
MSLKELIAFDDFAKLDLRVATVTACEPHPNADRLLKLQVDLGPEIGQRQICAGVRAFYEPEQLVGRQIVMVANLAPRKLRGEESQGMLLAATDASDEQVQRVLLLKPDAELPAGSQVG